MVFIVKAIGLNSKRLVFIILFSTSIVCTQSQKVYLNTLTKLNEEFIHLVTVSEEKPKGLILPKNSRNEVQLQNKFFSLFYSWDSENDEEISVLVNQVEGKDILYIDKNNDNDLTNDGEPLLFPLEYDSISFSISASTDPKQKLKLALFRTPNIDDSLKTIWVDSDGNISSNFLPYARIWSNDFDYEGKNRTFYFDYRLTLRRGILELDNFEYSVGLFDYTNNGIYDDSEDIFLIDLDKSGKLNYLVPSNIFALDDIFRIGDKNFKLSEIDKYGKFFELTETTEEVTFHHLEWQQLEYSKKQQKSTLSKNFSNSKFVTLTGDSIILSSFSGKYVFINFWGEWCLPCINKIPELQFAYKKFKEKVMFLGVLNPKNINQAKNFISENNILWDNIILIDTIKDEFDVKAYPTNVLIMPNGKDYVKELGINRTFFDMNIR